MNSSNFGVITCALALASTAAVMAGDHDAAAAARGHYKPLCDDATLPGGRRCHGWILADDNGVPIREAAPAPSGLGASDLEAAYHLPATGGNGTIIASVLGVHYPNAESDLAKYRTQYGLPPCTKANGCFMQVDGNGGTNYPQSGSCNGVAGESALDIQMLSAGCPDCKIMLIEPNRTSDSDAITMAIGKGVAALSFSFCGAETNSDLNQAAAWNHPGTGLFASSGDWGYLNHAGGMPGVCSPASFPGVVSVGGTTLTKSNTPRGWTESTWSSAGSGCSTVFPKPSWQTDTGCSKRMVADISAIAENVSNYCTDPGDTNGWGTVGGTSAAAPFVAGALTLIGAINADFTPAWVWHHADDLFDITTGNNGTCSSVSAYYCKAGTGYDGPTGLGTPNGGMPVGGTDGGRGGNGGGTDAGARDSARDSNDSGNGADASTPGTGGAGSTTTGTMGTTGSGGTVTTTGTAGGAGGSGGSAKTGQGGAPALHPAAGDDGLGCTCRMTRPSAAHLHDDWRMLLGIGWLAAACFERVRRRRVGAGATYCKSSVSGPGSSAGSPNLSTPMPRASVRSKSACDLPSYLQSKPVRRYPASDPAITTGMEAPESDEASPVSLIHTTALWSRTVPDPSGIASS